MRFLSYLIALSCALLLVLTLATVSAQNLSPCQQACEDAVDQCGDQCYPQCQGQPSSCNDQCQQNCGNVEYECMNACPNDMRRREVTLKKMQQKHAQAQAAKKHEKKVHHSAPLAKKHNKPAEKKHADKKSHPMVAAAGSARHPVKSVAHLHWPHHHHGGKKHHFWPDIHIIKHAEEEIKHGFEKYIRDFAKQYAQDEYPVAYSNFASAYDLIKSWNAGTHRFELEFNIDSDKSADDLPDEPEGQKSTARLHWGHHHHWWPHIHIPHRDIERLKHTFEGYVRDFAKAYLQAEFPIAYAAFSDVYDVVEAWKADRHRFDIVYGIYSDLTEAQIPDSN